MKSSQGETRPVNQKASGSLLLSDCASGKIKLRSETLNNIINMVWGVTAKEPPNFCSHELRYRAVLLTELQILKML